MSDEKTNYEREWLRPSAAAVFLGVSVSLLSRWKKEGVGPAWKSVPNTKNDYRYSRESLNEYMNQEQ